MSEYRYGIMRGYKLSIYKSTSEGFKSLENRTNGLFSPKANLTGLTPFTTYKVEVLGFNDFGDGPSTAVEVLTDESCKWILLSLLYNSGKNCTCFIYCSGNPFISGVFRLKACVTNLRVSDRRTD